MDIKYDLDKIKFATDEGTFQRAVGIYESGNIKNFEEMWDGFRAIVPGTEPYKVFVSAKYFDRGDCNCYVGKKEILCKHMVAVAIYAIKNGEKLTEKDIKTHNELTFSGKASELSKEELAQIKKSISEAMLYIKPYDGTSRIWFSYQDSLTEGANRLSAIFSDLPASPQNTSLIIKTLLKLDEKLSREGVDDSDGTVGDFIFQAVELLKQFATLYPKCIEEFKIFKNRETSFDWEEPLVELFNIASGEE